MKKTTAVVAAVLAAVLALTAGECVSTREGDGTGAGTVQQGR